MAAPAEEEEAAAAVAGEAEGGDGDEEALRRLEDLVTELYRFRDRLPHAAGGDLDRAAARDLTRAAARDPRDPAATLAEEMEKTLRLMEEVQVSPQGRGRALVLRARALGVSPAGAARAEEALSRAVKLEPGLSPAWTRLGEARWKRGDLEGARACFAGALAHGEDAEARRLLSMALRAGGEGGALRESLAQAEAAVRCAPTDGRSWYVLGNAYVSLFFAGGQSPEAARRALGAYAQAERVDPEAANNPDLHLNRATLLQYEERFGAALEGLGRAAALAPGWEEPRRRHAHLLDFLGRLCTLLANRGKLRGKRRRGLEGPVPPALLGPLGGPGGPLPAPLPALRPGANPRRVLLGRVLFCLSPEERVPYAVGLADGAGAVAAVTVYNAAPAWGLLVGDALAVPEPHLRQHHLQHQGKTFSFLGIRVPSPLSLVVNGRRPPPPALAPPRLALRNDVPSAPSLAPSMAAGAPSMAARAPSMAPSMAAGAPSMAPSMAAGAPSLAPSAPSMAPSLAPDAAPGALGAAPSAPSLAPSMAAGAPSTAPSLAPGALGAAPSAPSMAPGAPSAAPSAPSMAAGAPSTAPDAAPGALGAAPNAPSAPSTAAGAPSAAPSAPSAAPSAPSAAPGAGAARGGRGRQ